MIQRKEKAISIKSKVHGKSREILTRFINLILGLKVVEGVPFVQKSYSPSAKELPLITLEQLISKYEGVNIWKTLAPKDWPLYSEILFCENVIIVGGHTGSSTKKIVSDMPKIKSLQVYEPIIEFAKEIEVSTIVKVFTEAIWSHNGELDIQIVGDHTFASKTERALFVNKESESRVVPCITYAVAANRLGNGEITLIMNCEGSEYLILNSLLDDENLPRSIIFQSHKTGETPFHFLYSLRAKLAKSYTPIVCADWAWDIWVLSPKK